MSNRFSFSSVKKNKEETACSATINVEYNGLLEREREKKIKLINFFFIKFFLND